MARTLQDLLDDLCVGPWVLAQRAGVSPTTVRSLLRGEGRPWPRTMERIAAALAMPVDQVTAAVVATQRARRWAPRRGKAKR